MEFLQNIKGLSSSDHFIFGGVYDQFCDVFCFLQKNSPYLWYQHLFFPIGILDVTTFWKKSLSLGGTPIKKPTKKRFLYWIPHCPFNLCKNISYGWADICIILFHFFTKKTKITSPSKVFLLLQKFRSCFPGGS